MCPILASSPNIAVLVLIVPLEVNLDAPRFLILILFCHQIIMMLHGILHHSVRMVPMHTDAQYIPTGKPVELHVQKLATKRLSRKRCCTAGDLPTIKNIGGTISLFWKPLQKRSISSLHKLFFLWDLFLVQCMFYRTCEDTSGHISMMSQLPTPERLLVTVPVNNWFDHLWASLTIYTAE